MSPPQTSLRLALAQLNPRVGDIDGNAALAREAIAAAVEADADIVLLPELAISGYPPEDLLLRGDFLAACAEALDELAREVPAALVALVGCPLQETALHNSLAVLSGGRIAATYAKVHLPNYGVFDERRYFEPGALGETIDVRGVRVGLTVCEDIWQPGAPAADETRSGASLIVNASASPYHRAKGNERESIVAACARENAVTVALCNMVGGQDELVFDGESLIVGPDGAPIARGAQFDTDLLVRDLELPLGPSRDGGGQPAGGGRARAPVVAEVGQPPGDRPGRSPIPKPLSSPPLSSRLDPLEEVYAALTLGLRDYMAKNGFTHAVLGLSGGIDSALVAEIAADAIGAEAVTSVIMPSPHSSDETQSDARLIAANLGCPVVELGIGGLMEAYGLALAGPFAGRDPDLTEENLQARIRGNLVMALSNKFGWLPLSTGNKSEMSVGYTTLYGDMAGGFAVIKDVPKTLVYDLVEDRNRRAGGELIPASVIERPPSAELRPDQRDSDSLPPYEVLDAALEIYIERDGSRAGLVDAGIPEDVARRVADLVDRAEYKRRQAPPGVKISTKSFGRDRRLPITNHWKG